MTFLVLVISDDIGLGNRIATVSRSRVPRVQMLRRPAATSLSSYLDESSPESWPELVIVDLDMTPLRTIEEFMLAVRGDPRRGHLPVVAVATDANTEQAREAFGLGINACVPRPATKRDTNRLLSLGMEISSIATATYSKTGEPERRGDAHEQAAI